MGIPIFDKAPVLSQKYLPNQIWSLLSHENHSLNRRQVKMKQNQTIHQILIYHNSCAAPDNQIFLCLNWLPQMTEFFWFISDSFRSVLQFPEMCCHKSEIPKTREYEDNRHNNPVFLALCRWYSGFSMHLWISYFQFNNIADFFIHLSTNPYSPQLPLLLSPNDLGFLPFCGSVFLSPLVARFRWSSNLSLITSSPNSS